MLQFQTVEKYLTSFCAQDPQTIYLPISFILRTCTLHTLDTIHEKDNLHFGSYENIFTDLFVSWTRVEKYMH